MLALPLFFVLGLGGLALASGHKGSASRSYTVVSGESLWDIASKFSANTRANWLAELFAANPDKTVLVDAPSGRREWIGGTVKGGDVIHLPPEWSTPHVGAYDCSAPTYEDGSPYPPPPGVPVGTAPPRELRPGGKCSVGATMSAGDVVKVTAPALVAVGTIAAAAAIGTSIPIPGIGTAIGAVVGACIALANGYRAEGFHPTPLQAQTIIAVLAAEPELLFTSGHWTRVSAPADLGFPDVNSGAEAVKTTRHLMQLAGGPVGGPLADPHYMQTVYNKWKQHKPSHDTAAKTPAEAEAYLGAMRAHPDVFKDIFLALQFGGSKTFTDQLKALRRMAGEHGPDHSSLAKFGNITVGADPSPYRYGEPVRDTLHGFLHAFHDSITSREDSLSRAGMPLGEWHSFFSDADCALHRGPDEALQPIADRMKWWAQAERFYSSPGYAVGSWEGFFNTPGGTLEYMNKVDGGVDALNTSIREDPKWEGAPYDFKDGWKGFYDMWKAFYQRNTTGFTGGWVARTGADVYDDTVAYEKQLGEWRAKWEALGGKPNTPPLVTSNHSLSVPSLPDAATTKGIGMAFMGAAVLLGVGVFALRR